MRKLEIILKILFLAMFVFVYRTYSDYFGLSAAVFILISFLLGLVLMVNKDQSYGYPLSFHEVVERRIEGVLLIVFSLAAVVLHLANLI